MAAPATVDLATVGVGMLGGLGLFLHGMSLLTGSLRTVAGERLRAVLARMVGNRVKALLSGVVVTAITQSSSLTTVLLVGFVSAGVLALPQAVGVILGANIGSTFTAQLIAFDVGRSGLVLVALGVVLAMIRRVPLLREAGAAALALGLVFFGLSLMSDAARPLRDYPPFVDALASLHRPALGILAGCVFTAIVQSSAATTGLAIVLAGEGFIPLETGIALALGANVGTCATAGLAAIGRPRAAAQVALVHVLFNVLGVLAWWGFIPQLAEIVRAISPAAPLDGDGVLAASVVPRQIANAHTLFNVVNAAVVLPLTPLVARLVTRLLPIRPTPEESRATPRYLDPALVETPSLALAAARRETARMGRHVIELLEHAFRVAVDGDAERIDALAARDDAARLHERILEYLRRVGREHLAPDASRELEDVLVAADHIETMADLARANLVLTARDRVSHRVVLGAATVEKVRTLARAVLDAATAAVTALERDDAAAAAEVVARKGALDALADDATAHLARRLLADDPNRVPTVRVESELIATLRRVYYLAKRVAKIVAVQPDHPPPADGAPDAPR